MKRLSLSFSLFALLIIIICSAILPVFSLQNNMSIPSYGTINYSGPPPSPTPTPTPTPPPSQYENEIFLFFGKSLTQDLINKIISAKQTTGYPDYVDVGNWGADRAHWLSDHFTEDKIVQLQSAGIKCICQIPTDWMYIPDGGEWDGDYITEAEVRAMIDHQISIGPSIDGFFFDCTANFGDYGPEWGEVWDKYVSLSNYVRNDLGKILFTNPGTRNIGHASFTIADYVCVEFDYANFVSQKQYLVQAYPNRFQGLSSIGELSPVDVHACVTETVAAWNMGVYVFGPPADFTMEDWAWQQYLSQLPN